MNIQYAFQTHIGNRHENQDYLGHVQTEFCDCFVVTDGCGGHHASALAARFFCENLLYYSKTSSSALFQSPKKAAKELFNLAVGEMSRQLTADRKFEARTTCAAVWLNDQFTIATHIGDSRIYHLTKQGIWHTRDDSLIQALIETGRVSEGQRLVHPWRDFLTKSIGINVALSPNITVRDPLQAGEALIICSDGFWREVSDTQLFELAQADNLQEALDALVNKIVGGHDQDLDNITVQVIRGG